MSFEKVNPSHPDKVADRIAGAIVDLAYKKQENPKIAVEVLIGHGDCNIIAETSVRIEGFEINEICERIIGCDVRICYTEVPQDKHLAANQAKNIRCGDNGIFKGVFTNQENRSLSYIVRRLYEEQQTDGKYIWEEKSRAFIACQSCTNDSIEGLINGLAEDNLGAKNIIINPLGRWTGGIDVDTGATNRKLGSDMGRAVTGGGLHGKDLSKADVSVNIACYLLAQEYRTTVEAFCAIGDEEITFVMHRAGNETTEKTMPYTEVVEMARKYINELGGFEKLAEWGLI